jgi:hypothetical protein
LGGWDSPLDGHDGFCPIPAMFTLEADNERLQDGIREVRLHIAPMHAAYDMLLVLLNPLQEEETWLDK